MGNGTGLIEDSTGQAILAALGASTPQGGPGTGLMRDATGQAIVAAISGGGGGAKTAATVTSSQTYPVLSTDTAIRFDTTGGTTATAVLPAPTYIGQRITFYWWAWSGAQVAPTINASAGEQFVPFSGQVSSGAAGLVTTTIISTPGASFSLEWNGTEWMAA